MQRLREKIVEQEAEHIKLVNENNKLKADKQITVSIRTEWLCWIVGFFNITDNVGGSESRFSSTSLHKQ